MRSNESRLGQGGPGSPVKDDDYGYGPGATRRTMNADSY